MSAGDERSGPRKTLGPPSSSLSTRGWFLTDKVLGLGRITLSSVPHPPDKAKEGALITATTPVDQHLHYPEMANQHARHFGRGAGSTLSSVFSVPGTDQGMSAEKRRLDGAVQYRGLLEPRRPTPHPHVSKLHVTR
ncbi:hypothetical protein VTI28DRAFT_5605 [Corynascus sepedonium]